jgi:hypothetical protein
MFYSFSRIMLSVFTLLSISFSMFSLVTVTAANEPVIQKNLNVPYINQCNNSAGVFTRQGTKDLTGGLDYCQRHCGAASATMIAAYFGKLSYGNNTDTLREFITNDKGINLGAKNCNKFWWGLFDNWNSRLSIKLCWWN